MDHSDTLEQLELAAVEPGGLDRLIAGDTAMAAAVAGHVAGCDVCATELERLRRSVPLIRDIVRTTPPEDLRERTLAFVREHGERRASASMPDAIAPFPDATPAVTVGPATTAGASAAGGGARGAIGWIAAVAAAVVISVGATFFLMDQRLDAQDRQIAGLSAVTQGTLRVTAEPDAERVALAAMDGSDSEGTLLYSPTTTELVVVATGLSEPPSGQEYRCWVEVDGERQPIGKMFFGGGLAYWVGPASVGSLPDDASFGVSLMEVDGGPVSPDPVIAGEL